MNPYVSREPVAARNPMFAKERRTDVRAGAWAIGWIATALIILDLIAYHAYAYSVYAFSVTAGFFAVVAVISITMAILAAKGFDKYEDAEVPAGKMIAIIPVYNEDPQLLRDTIDAILASTVQPDLIHVVDDGSVVPVVPFSHPRIQWHRQDNAGKRMAQALVLQHYTVDEIDYLLTVDSDSVVAPHAIGQAIRAFNDPEVQAITSLVMVHKPKTLLGLLNDLDIVSGILWMRRARAALGAVAPTSGALSIYRAAPILDNLEDYVTSGTFSDDRRMAHYCLLRGKVVMVNGAVVASDIPGTVRGTWRQRVRWYKGYWKYLGWELANLSGAPLYLRMYNTVMTVVFPLVMIWLFVYLPATGRGFFWPVLVLWLSLVYAQTLVYAARRPYMSWVKRVSIWLFLTPLLIPFQVLLVRPAMYWAAWTARNEKWDGHRNLTSPQDVVVP